MNAPERPDGGCLTHHPPAEGRHWQRAEGRWLICGSCYDRIREDLKEVGERYVLLDPAPGSTGWDQSAPGFESNPTGSLHIMAMRDPRSSPTAKEWEGDDGKTYREQERPPLSVYSVLNTAAWEVAERCGLTGPADTDDVYALVEWLDRRLDWAARKPLVKNLREELARLLGQLRDATGDRRTKIGPCPNQLDDGSYCNAPLWSPPPGSSTIFCGACGRPWPRPVWEHMGRMIDT